MRAIGFLFPFSVGFGLEKLGFISLKYPRAVLAIVITISAILMPGGLLLDFESDTRDIFRSKSKDFKVLEQLIHQYPGTINDVLLVVEGDELFQIETLDKLRNVHLDLQFIEGVKSVRSIFSARQAPTSGTEDSKPLFPEEMDKIDDIGKFGDDLLNNAFVAGKLLSPDRTIALFVISLDAKDRELDEFKDLLVNIEQITDEMLEGSGLAVSMTGPPVMRVEIIDSLKRDQMIFKIVGFTLGFILSWLFFRKLKYVVIANMPVTTTLIWLQGGMWLFGQKINVLTSMVTPLIMVIALSNALHMLFAIRRNLAANQDLEDAISTAVREVGPACVLTSLTTAIALLTLTLVPYSFISNFGLTAACGTITAYFSTMLVIPALSLLILQKWPATEEELETRRGLASMVESVCTTCAETVKSWPRAVALAGVLVTALFSLLYALNEPHYTSRENLPEDNAAFRAILKIDDRLAGTARMELFITLPKDQVLLSGKTLELARDAHNFLKSKADVKEVWSLHSLADWLRSGGLTEPDIISFLKKNEDQIINQSIAKSPNTILVTGYFRDTDAAVLLPKLNSLQGQLEELRKKHSEATINLTGTSPIEAKTSYHMIHRLNISLLTAIAFIIVLIAFALRSARAGLASILPNLLPIAAGGAYLYLIGAGLQFTSVIAFTIGFGIAVDSTIHFFIRYRLEREAGKNAKDAVYGTTIAIGPVLIVSTVILAAGLGVTMLSNLPMVELYGRVSVLVLAMALVGDILFLPAFLRIIEQLRAATVSEPEITEAD